VLTMIERVKAEIAGQEARVFLIGLSWVSIGSASSVVTVKEATSKVGIEVRVTFGSRL
jgi:hypothetical protein